MKKYVNEKRMIKNFTELVKIDSLSFKEAKFAKHLIKELKKLGCKVFVDNSAKKTGSDTGNIIAKLKGNINSKPLLLSAHLDTVSPGINIKPKISKNKITSDGSTILAADCKAGIAIILEILKTLKEKKSKHPPLEIVFTTAEEAGMFGSKHLDYSKIKSKYAVVLDSNIENCAVTKAAAKNVFEINVTGLASHAAMEPEKGISALKIAAYIISNFETGRIDKETVANIAVISGGTTTNVITPNIKMKGEMRSLNDVKLNKQVKKLEAVCKLAVKKFTKKIDGKIFAPKTDIKMTRQYKALNMDANTPVMKALQKAHMLMGIKMKNAAVPAGSDGNIFAEKAEISSVLTDTGMEKVHSVKEYLDIKRFSKCGKILLNAVLKFKK